MDAVNILFFYSVNVTVGVNEDRQMLTGMHTVADIFCVGCGSIVGWKYVRFVTVLQEYDFVCLYIELISYHIGFFQETAHEKSQKYKEGKSVLERSVEMLCEKTLLI